MVAIFAEQIKYPFDRLMTRLADNIGIELYNVLSTHSVIPNSAEYLVE